MMRTDAIRDLVFGTPIIEQAAYDGGSMATRACIPRPAQRQQYDAQGCQGEELEQFVGAVSAQQQQGNPEEKEVESGREG
ncbi:hypothetical protein SE17_02565, partial [Kouleothrix aurantiaca]